MKKYKKISMILVLSLVVSLIPGIAFSSEKQQVFTRFGECKKIENGNCLQLVPAQSWKGGGIWSRNMLDLSSSFSLKFDFYMGEGRGVSGMPDHGDGADGISISFTQSLPVGDLEMGEGQSFYGEGAFGVEYDTWYNDSYDPFNDHIAIIKDSVSNHLQRKDYIDQELDDCKWHSTEVNYNNGILEVKLDGKSVAISDKGQLPEVKSAYLCIAAATGIGTNVHKIRNVQINGVKAILVEDVEEPISNYSAEQNGYPFVNGFEGFGYSSNYEIPIERYEEVFGASGKLLFNKLKKKDKEWSGNCYGMAVTSVLFEQKLLNINDFFPGAICANDCYSNVHEPWIGGDYASISSSSQLTCLIERYQILKKSNANLFIQNVPEDNLYWTIDDSGHYRHNLSGSYIGNLKNFFESVKFPIIVNMFWGKTGHSVIALPNQKNLEEVIDDKNSARWYRLQVYDPNTPYWNQNIKELSNLKPYYYNNRTDKNGAGYIDLNIESNLFRYVRGNGEVVGTKDGKSANILDKKSGKPDYICIEFTEFLPILANQSKAISILPGPNYNLDYQDVIQETTVLADGEEVAKIDRTGVLCFDEEVYDMPKVESEIVNGETSNEQMSNSGTLSLPAGHTYTVKCKDGYYILRGEDSMVTIQPDLAETSFEVNLKENQVAALSNADTTAGITLANVHDTDQFSAIELNVSLTKNATTELGLNDEDVLSIDGSRENTKLAASYMTEDDEKFISIPAQQEDLLNGLNVSTIANFSLSLDKNAIDLKKGESERINLKITPEPVITNEVIWTSQDPSIATVKNGLISGISAGTTKITASVLNKKVSCTVTVTASPTESGGGHTQSKQVLIESSAKGNGTITPAGNITIPKGSPKTFTITPDSGYEIADVLIDGKSVGAVSAYTFENVTSNHTISATFKKKEKENNKDFEAENLAKKIKAAKDVKVKASSSQGVNKKGKRYIKVKWTKKGAAVTGYQVYRSFKKKSSYKKFYTTKKKYYYNTKALKKGKRHYYKVRAYTVIGGKKYYSKWSNLAYRTVKK